MFLFSFSSFVYYSQGSQRPSIENENLVQNQVFWDFFFSFFALSLHFYILHLFVTVQFRFFVFVSRLYSRVGRLLLVEKMYVHKENDDEKSIKKRKILMKKTENI